MHRLIRGRHGAAHRAHQRRRRRPTGSPTRWPRRSAGLRVPAPSPGPPRAPGPPGTAGSARSPSPTTAGGLRRPGRRARCRPPRTACASRATRTGRCDRRGRRRRRRLPARHACAARRRRLPHHRPAPPPGRGVPRARRPGAGRRRALGGGVDLAAGGPSASSLDASGERGYGGDPGQHARHRPVDLPGRPLTTGPDQTRPRSTR